MSSALHDHQDQVPPGMLRAAGALIVVTLVAVAWSRLAGPPAPMVPEARTLSVRALYFEDRPDGSVAVIDAKTGRLADTLAPGADGFIRATLRTFAHERQRRGIGRQVPFEIRRLEDGRVLLIDSAVGRSVDLEAFGATNFAAFARLIDADAANPARPLTVAAPRKDPR